MNRLHFAAVAIASSLIFTACGGGSEERTTTGDGQELVIAFDGSPTNLDPRIGTDTHSGRIWDMSASGLIRLTPSGEYIGDIADSWETPDDLTIIFKLKPNAKFQDGRPVTSADFKFTYDSLMAENFNSPKKSGYASVAAFEAPDPQTFIVRLKEPNAGIFDNFPYLLVPEGANADWTRLIVEMETDATGLNKFEPANFDAKRGDSLVAFGWAMAEDLAKLA